MQKDLETNRGLWKHSGFAFEGYDVPPWKGTHSPEDTRPLPVRSHLRVVGGLHHSRAVGCRGSLLLGSLKSIPIPIPGPWQIITYGEPLLAGAISHTSPSSQTRNSGSEKLWPRSCDRPCPHGAQTAGGGDNSQGTTLPCAQVARWMTVVVLHTAVNSLQLQFPPPPSS